MEEPRRSFLEGCCYRLPHTAISTCGARLPPSLHQASASDLQSPSHQILKTFHCPHWNTWGKQGPERSSIPPKVTQPRRLTPDLVLTILQVVLRIEPDFLAAAPTAVHCLLPTGSSSSSFSHFPGMSSEGQLGDETVLRSPGW